MLRLNILTSKAFGVSPPLIIDEAKKRGFTVKVYKDTELPTATTLLDCDLYIDFSSITQTSFYMALNNELNRLVEINARTPLVIDPPLAVMGAMDKRKTHALFPDLVPESYDLNGINNVSLIDKFKDDKYVVIKDPFGWQSKGVERLSPTDAIKKYRTSKDLIVQKYIFSKNVGRILTVNSKSKFEIICAYERTPKNWKTEENGYTCKQSNIGDDLKHFAKIVSKKCGLYLNGIDYIYTQGKYLLLEVNAAPGLKEPLDEFGINAAKILFDHVEKDLSTK